MKDVAVRLRTGLCDPDGSVSTIINRGGDHKYEWTDGWRGRKKKKRGNREKDINRNKRSGTTGKAEKVREPVAEK